MNNDWQPMRTEIPSTEWSTASYSISTEVYFSVYSPVSSSVSRVVRFSVERGVGDEQ